MDYSDNIYCLLVWPQDVWWWRWWDPHPDPEVRTWHHQSGWNNALSQIGANLWTRRLEKTEEILLWWLWRQILHDQQWNNEVSTKICWTSEKYSRQWSYEVSEKREKKIPNIYPDCWKQPRWWKNYIDISFMKRMPISKWELGQLFQKK